jgi:hypothetical protein
VLKNGFAFQVTLAQAEAHETRSVKCFHFATGQVHPRHSKADDSLDIPLFKKIRIVGLPYLNTLVGLQVFWKWSSIVLAE